MNTKQQKQTVAIAVMIAIVSVMSQVSTVSAHTPNFLNYGELNHQEDELYFMHDGMMYINAVPSQGNGMFMSESDIETSYSVDSAIERFGINEDSHSFSVQPSQYSDVELTFMFNDETLKFELIGATQ